MIGCPGASLLDTLTSSILKHHSLVDEARDANRMKDQFMATASHELKTPLTSICLRVGLLRRMKTPTEEQLREGLNMNDRSVRTQTKLVDDLLETSRVTTGKLRLDIENIDPAELIRSAVETVTPGAEAKGIEISVKFTPKEGFVAIDAREVAGSYVVEVRDSGRGIDPEALPRVFDAFFQIQTKNDSSNNGLGLGLSVAKAVVDLHGGMLRAASEGKGRGACFTASIPSVDQIKA